VDPSLFSGWPTTLILLFCEEVLSLRSLFQHGLLTQAAGITDSGYSGANEVERANILAPGLTFFPPSPLRPESRA
jgi:hypothetical protein